MPLRITCPEGHALVVSQARGGATLSCPKCGARVVVPPAAPQRPDARSERAAVAVEAEQELRAATAAVLGEPQPPPVVAPASEVAPPPVWCPPPKSRAIVDSLPTPPTPPELNRTAEKEPEIEAPPQPTHGAPQGAKSSAPGDSPLPSAAQEPAVAALRPPAAELPNLPSIPGERQQPLAYVLAICLGAAALFGAGPAVWDVMQYLQAEEDSFVARWALALLALGFVQVAYAVYFAQLPDWSSGWVVTLLSLALAALYAGMLGVTLIAGSESFLVRSLQLSDALVNGRAAMWCLCMTSIMATLAFFAGRTSLRWRQAAA